MNIEKMVNSYVKMVRSEVIGLNSLYEDYIKMIEESLLYKKGLITSRILVTQEIKDVVAEFLNRFMESLMSDKIIELEKTFGIDFKYRDNGALKLNVVSEILRNTIIFIKNHEGLYSSKYQLAEEENDRVSCEKYKENIMRLKDFNRVIESKMSSLHHGEVEARNAYIKGLCKEIGVKNREEVKFVVNEMNKMYDEVYNRNEILIKNEFNKNKDLVYSIIKEILISA